MEWVRWLGKENAAMGNEAVVAFAGLAVVDEQEILVFGVVEIALYQSGLGRLFAVRKIEIVVVISPLFQQLNACIGTFLGVVLQPETLVKASMSEAALQLEFSIG